MEDLVNVPQHQTALAGLLCVVSGAIARPQTSLTVTQMLGSVPQPQTALNGLRPAPSGDIVKKRTGSQTKHLARQAGETNQQGEAEKRLEEGEREGK